ATDASPIRSTTWRPITRWAASAGAGRAPWGPCPPPSWRSWPEGSPAGFRKRPDGAGGPRPKGSPVGQGNPQGLPRLEGGVGGQPVGSGQGVHGHAEAAGQPAQGLPLADRVDPVPGDDQLLARAEGGGRQRG